MIAEQIKKLEADLTSEQAAENESYEAYSRLRAEADKLRDICRVEKLKLTIAALKEAVGGAS